MEVYCAPVWIGISYCIVQDSTSTGQLSCSQGPNQHVLDRHAVTTVKCAHCGLEQPVAQQCSGCLQSFGKYSCLECNFFDEDTSKRQFHCNMCGICRVGACRLFCECALNYPRTKGP